MRLPGAAVAVALFIMGAHAQAQQTEVKRGEYLIHAGGCIDCHTEDSDEASALTGGRAIESPFGTFFSPNITPDDETGIGSWSDDEFLTAFWDGVNPDGDHYYPAFPYTSYTGISRKDLLAMKAYLFSLKPVEQTTPEHELAWYISTRLAAGAWKLKNFDSARFSTDPEQLDQLNRGAYLVRHLAHCGECHTPRSSLGALQYEHELAGNPDGPDSSTVTRRTAMRPAP